MSKHTPVPWQVIDSNVYGNGLRSLLPANGADAKLMAAAPDLLRELKRLVAAVDRLPSNPLDGLADEARAAIAKAEG